MLARQRKINIRFLISGKDFKTRSQFGSTPDVYPSYIRFPVLSLQAEKYFFYLRGNRFFNAFVIFSVQNSYAV
jgi:hypothetical protein